jgi:DNA-binding transcriptional MerR regulator
MESLALMFENKVDPDKLYYKIGEVSKLLNVRSSVIRYWETEFNLRTTKSKANQRLYEKSDIEKLINIKKLLYNERFTLEGAKKRLKEIKENYDTNNINIKSKDNNPTYNLLEKIKKELETIATHLRNGVK